MYCTNDTPVHLSVPPPFLSKNKNIFNHFNFQIFMDKKDLVAKSLDKVVSEAAVNALAEGKGTRAIGSPLGISVGDKYTIMGIDYRENWFAPEDRDLTTSEINEMTDKEKEEAGCRKQGWFVFITNNGDLSFSAVLGDSQMTKAEFWDDKAQKAEGFDVATIFVPSARTPAAWIKQGCDGLVGKELVCVATKDFKRGNFDAKARGFIITTA